MKKGIFIFILMLICATPKLGVAQVSVDKLYGQSFKAGIYSGLIAGVTAGALAYYLEPMKDKENKKVNLMVFFPLGFLLGGATGYMMDRRNVKKAFEYQRKQELEDFFKSPNVEFTQIYNEGE